MQFPESLTRHLNLMQSEDLGACQRALQSVYPELVQIAGRIDWHSAADGTTQAMELASEAIVRLTSGSKGWTDRRHFFASFAQAVRSVRVDEYRRRRRQAEVVADTDLDVVREPDGLDPYDVIDLEQALQQIEREEPTAGQILTLRFYLGLSMEQIAEDLDISMRRCKSLWALSQARLSRLLRT